MKQVQLLLASALLFVGLAAQAQQITIKKETVLVDGKPYCMVVKSGSTWARDFSFRSLKNEELVVAKPILHDLGGGQDYVYYQITIKGTAAKSEMEDQENLVKVIAGELYANQVFTPAALNQEGVQKLLAKYPPAISARLKEQELLSQQAAESFVGKGPDAGAEVPDAVILVPSKAPENKSKAAAPAAPLNNIYLNGNTLFKDNIKIGQFKVIDQTEDDKKERIYSIFNNQNKIIAVATFATMDAASCTVSTIKDSRSHELNLKNDNRAIKTLTEWLVANQYL